MLIEQTRNSFATLDRVMKTPAVTALSHGTVYFCKRSFSSYRGKEGKKIFLFASLKISQKW